MKSAIALILGLLLLVYAAFGWTALHLIAATSWLEAAKYGFVLLMLTAIIASGSTKVSA